MGCARAVIFSCWEFAGASGLRAGSRTSSFNSWLLGINSSKDRWLLAEFLRPRWLLMQWLRATLPDPVIAHLEIKLTSGR
jgi:hypothetical protein